MFPDQKTPTAIPGGMLRSRARASQQHAVMAYREGARARLACTRHPGFDRHVRPGRGTLLP